MKKIKSTSFWCDFCGKAFRKGKWYSVYMMKIIKCSPELKCVENVLPKVLNLKTSIMKINEKTRRQLDYACKQASKCRRDKYHTSCNSCPEREDCEIQQRIIKAKLRMAYGS
jgi:hypothetical protein